MSGGKTPRIHILGKYTIPVEREAGWFLVSVWNRRQKQNLCLCWDSNPNPSQVSQSLQCPITEAPIRCLH